MKNISLTKKITKELGFLLITTAMCFFYLHSNNAISSPDLSSQLSMKSHNSNNKLSQEQEKELFLSLVNNVKVNGVKVDNGTLDTEKALKLMIEWKVNPDYMFTTIGEKIGDKTYIINFTIQNGLLGFLRKLIERGANINIKDQFGSTPLHYAASLSPEILPNKFMIIETLVAYGADKNVKDSNGKMPIDLLKNPNIYSNPDIKSEETKVYNYLKYNLITLPAPTEPTTGLADITTLKRANNNINNSDQQKAEMLSGSSKTIKQPINQGLKINK